MSVGKPVDRTSMDYWSGTVAQDIATVLERVDSLHAFLSGTSDADLEAPPFNYATQDVAYLKSAINDLEHLAQIYRGETDLAAAYDFRTFVQHLQGLGIPV
jgi:hypothetical protein